MQAIQGYFDGTTVKPLEKFNAKPNQRVIITIMDEFVEPPKTVPAKACEACWPNMPTPS